MHTLLKKTIKFLVASLLFFLSCFLILYIILEFVLNPCSSTVLKSKSLNEKQKIVLFTKGCGATTSNAYHLSIMDIDKSVTDRSAGNLIIYDGRHFSFSLTEGKIHIDFDEDGKFYKKEKLNDVIDYNN